MSDLRSRLVPFRVLNQAFHQGANDNRRLDAKVFEIEIDENYKDQPLLPESMFRFHIQAGDEVRDESSFCSPLWHPDSAGRPPIHQGQRFAPPHLYVYGPKPDLEAFDKLAVRAVHSLPRSWISAGTNHVSRWVAFVFRVLLELKAPQCVNDQWYCETKATSFSGHPSALALFDDAACSLPDYRVSTLDSWHWWKWRVTGITGGLFAASALVTDAMFQEPPFPFLPELLEVTAPPGSHGEHPQQAKALAPAKPSKLARALAVLAEHPDWSNKQIAGTVGCNPKYLSQEKKFKAARKAIQESGRRGIPHGSKDQEGNLEADLEG